MLKLSIDEIKRRIKAGTVFECESECGSFIIKIDDYSPSICTAIHSGHRFRDSLKKRCSSSEEMRYSEEDPKTDVFIESMPVTIILSDSRYEYDLNRTPEACLYRKAWGLDSWKKRERKSEIYISMRKYREFYQVIEALIDKTEEMFGSCLVFDVHSFNHVRIDKVSPVFNLGTSQIDISKWDEVIKMTLNRLSEIKLTDIPVTALKDSVFYGRGYLAMYIKYRFKNTLVLPIEIKKIYMDEILGVFYPEVIEMIKSEFGFCLRDIADFFEERFTRSVSKALKE